MLAQNLKLILLSAAVVVGFTAVQGRAATHWVEQGPGPIWNGLEAGLPVSPDAGAITAVLPLPENADALLVGTANGGIWATFDATAASPHWTPLTDQALPALSIASLAKSPVNDDLFAGTGSLSAAGGVGSRGFGIARSADGGSHWSILGASTFDGEQVNSVVPTTLLRGNVLLAATRAGDYEAISDPDSRSPLVPAAAETGRKLYGVFRSSNVTAPNPTQVSFTRISGASGSGLPDGGVSALIADPANPKRFYAAVSARDAGPGHTGVYVSQNGGVAWTRVDGSGTNTLTGLSTSLRILLSVHNDASNNVIYAAVIAGDGMLSGVFRSTNQGAAWTHLGVPSPAIYPGKQGGLHGALVADPKNADVVFISGDSQPEPFPNANGCRSFSGNAFRGDASQPPAQRWQNLVCDAAQGTAPHADSRAMAFDANGDLLEANDGGVARLFNPDGGSRRWASVVGNIRPTELHSVAYDPLSKVIFGGAQDNGTSVQATTGGFGWNEFTGGDGGVVAIDADQRRHPGVTLRYGSSQELGNFVRSSWDTANNFLGATVLDLDIVSGGPCAGQTITECDKSVQFYTPFVLSAIDPRRMLMGTAYLYESANSGDSLTSLGYLGQTVGANGLYGRPMAYGGSLGGKTYPGVFYVGAGKLIYHRVQPGQDMTTLAAYTGGVVRTVAMNPHDYRQVYVLDVHNRIWESLDEGAHWRTLTRNLNQLTDQVATIALFAPDADASHSVVIAGGFGVFQLRNSSTTTVWSALGTGAPHALFGDLEYDAQDDLLLAGSMGRGAWTLTGFFTGKGPAVGSRDITATPQQAPTPYAYHLPPIPAAAVPTRAR